MPKALRLRLLLLLLPLVGAITSPGVAQRGAHKVLLLSDTHFNPFPTEQQCAQPEMRRHMAELAARPGTQWTAADFSFQSGFSPHGEDSNWPLLASSIAAARKALPHPDAVIVSGDLLVHHADRAFADCFAPTGEVKDPAAFTAFLVQTIAFELQQLETAFPETPIISALGNNDTDTGDYKLPSAAFLSAVAPLFGRAAEDPSSVGLAATFAAGGYYSVTVPKLGHGMVLVLNSNAFSTQAQRGDAARSGAAAVAELEWLRAELDDARKHHRSVLVVGHMPPGLDAFLSHADHSVVMMYASCARHAAGCNSYESAVPDALTEYAATVRLGIFGHTHMDDIRISGAAGVPLEIVPSISPIVGNNPGFVVLTLAADLAPLDHTVWRLPLGSAQPQWYSEYSFRQAYKLPDFSAASLELLHHKLLDDLAIRQAYFTNFNGDSNMAKVPEKWQPAYLCALTHATAEQVTPCLLEAVGMPFAP